MGCRGFRFTYRDYRTLILILMYTRLSYIFVHIIRGIQVFLHDMYRHIIDSIPLRLNVVCSSMVDQQHCNIDLNSYSISGLSYVAFGWMIIGLLHSTILQFKMPVKSSKDETTHITIYHLLGCPLNLQPTYIGVINPFTKYQQDIPVTSSGGIPQSLFPTTAESFISILPLLVSVLWRLEK